MTPYSSTNQFSNRGVLIHMGSTLIIILIMMIIVKIRLPLPFRRHRGINLFGLPEVIVAALDVHFAGEHDLLLRKKGRFVLRSGCVFSPFFMAMGRNPEVGA